MTVGARLGLAILFGPAILFTLGTASADDSRDPAGSAGCEVTELVYSKKTNAVAQYRVGISIGDGAETYTGTLAYTCQGDGRWDVEGELRQKETRRRQRFGASPVAFPATPYLTSQAAVRSKLRIDPHGKVEEQTGEHQLECLLGDFTLFALWPLPSGEQKKWTLSEPLIVRQTSRDPRFGFLIPSRIRSPFQSDRLSAGLEKTTFRVTRREGDSVTLEHDYSLKMDKAKTPVAVTGTGTAAFDVRRGIFTRVQWQRSLKQTSVGGAEIRVPIEVELDLVSDLGFVPLTEEQRAAIAAAEAKRKAYAESPAGKREAAERAADAKRRAEEAKRRRADAQRRMDEAKAKLERQREAPFEPAKREAWIKQFEAANQYGDGARLYGELIQKSPRQDPELARAIFDYANRLQAQSGSFASMFIDLSARFDRKIAAIAELRKKLLHSHSRIEELGEIVAEKKSLRPGQLVLVQRRPDANDYRPRFVVRSDARGTLVRLTTSTRPEPTDGREVRLPPGRILPFLPLEQRPGETRSGEKSPSPTAEAQTPDDGAPATASESSLRLWKDKTGRFSVRASFAWLDGDQVRLEREDGKPLAISIDRLCEDDQEFARRAHAAANPFREP